MGSIGCPCIDASGVLASLYAASNAMASICSNSEIFFPDRSGKALCYPRSYGSSTCLPHDNFIGACAGHFTESARFCTQSWCYIDAETCKSSKHLMQLSDNFPTAGLMYSYSTCNSSAAPWNTWKTTSILTGKSIVSTVPGLEFPAHFKVDNDGHSIVQYAGDAYYDAGVPWTGAVPDYLNTIAELSDMDGFNFTWRSGGGTAAQPTSSYTAAVQDVKSGVAEMGVALFWITTARLEMTPFTTPLYIDQVLLWIPAPVVDNSFSAKVQTVVEPFEYSL